LLVVEDDPDVRELLEELLTTEGHRVVTASDAVVALATVTRTHFRPDLLLTDFNLPNGPNGLDLVTKLRDTLHYDVPGIIITGDISTGTLRDIAFQKCVRLNKPVKLAELSQAIQRLLPISRAAPEAPVVSAIRFNPTRSPLVYVVDDDAAVRGAISAVLEDDGRSVQTFASCKDFLDAYRPEREGCLLIDAYLPDMSGLELLAHLNATGRSLPSIMITGSSDVPMAVQAMKAGAADFIEKPIGRAELLTAIDRTMDHSRDRLKLDAWHRSASEDVAGLTARQREIMQMVVAGQPSKNIAADLGISQRTVENHRAEIMKRTGSKSLPALARLAVAAGWNGADDA